MANENNTTSQGERFLKIFSAVLIIINFIIAFLVYPKLPEQVPSHWNFKGEVDGYSGPFAGAFMLPLVLLGCYIMFWIIPRIDPRRANYMKMGRVFWIISTALIVFLSALYWSTIAIALGYMENLPPLIYLGSGLLFIILGNYFGKIRFNYTLGIRTPWTLANEEVWYKTHRFAGPIWIIGGLVMVIAGFLPSFWPPVIFVISLLIITLIPMVYSFILFRKIDDTN
ncbi:MAG: SdpI family protein [Desulfitobacterium sp.]|nr:SdpI family protein [Desulfitobacterium sp.]